MSTAAKVQKLIVHDIEAKTRKEYEPGSIPDNYLWAYRHIINHDCGSISCGKTVFEVVYG